MDTVQHIEFIDRQEGPWVSMEDEHAYQVRSDRPRVWLQRICVWVLKRLKAYRRTDTKEVRYVLVDRKKIADEIDRRKAAGDTE